MCLEHCERGFDSCLAATFLTPTYEANIRIQCGGKAHQTIKGVLRFLDPAGSNTVTVNGNCHENVVVQSLDRLTLITTSGAAHTPPAPAAHMRVFMMRCTPSEAGVLLASNRMIDQVISMWPREICDTRSGSSE